LAFTEGLEEAVCVEGALLDAFSFVVVGVVGAAEALVVLELVVLEETTEEVDLAW
jgi:hypothetical protein